MAKYGSSYYGASKYGATPKLAYSVEPMGITVISFTETDLSWQSPKGSFSRIRLVRNQNGLPEHSEDGVIVWEEFATEGTVSRSSIRDGIDNPESISIVPGKPIHYTMFLFTSAKIWVKAGSITDVIPRDHDSNTKILNTLPRVFTSKEQSPLAEVDTSSALSAFLGGFSFTYDEFLTYIDLLIPSHTRLETPISLIYPETTNYGLTFEPGISTRSQKKLIRESIYMYSHKGTALGLGTYAESLTGYSPTISVSPNLLLSIQDSTFYGSTGNWVATNATISSSTEQVASTNSNNIDTTNSCKIVGSSSGDIKLGFDTPITKAVPVLPSTDYTLSLELKCPSSSGSITPTITFFDKDGNFISSHSGTSVSANNTWKQAKVTATSDDNAVYAGITVEWSASGTYYVDMVCVQEGTEALYDEARAVTVFLEPNKTNYINNPSFEVNVTDSWTSTGSVTITTDTDVSSESYSGSSSAKLVATDSWTYSANKVPVNAGSYYTASLYGKTSGTFDIKVKTYDDSDTLLTTSSATVTGNGVWNRYYFTSLVDANSQAATIEMSLSGESGTFYIDCVQFENTYSLTEYFDGSLPSEYGAVWEGSDDDSYSHIYYGKGLKMERLRDTISDWLPSNCWWRITSYAGLEYTVLDV